MRLLAGLYPDPLGSLKRSPDPLAELWGGEGRRGGKGKEMKTEGQWEGRGEKVEREGKR